MQAMVCRFEACAVVCNSGRKRCLRYLVTAGNQNSKCPRSLKRKYLGHPAVCIAT